MTLTELGPIVWPVGITAATAIVIGRLRAARRRGALNRALHELRRPLKALVLSSGLEQGPGAHALRVAACALDDLDREINGDEPRTELRPVACRALVEPAVERWRGGGEPQGADPSVPCRPASANKVKADCTPALGGVEARVCV